MTVEELRQKLSGLPGDLSVFFYLDSPYMDLEFLKLEHWKDIGIREGEVNISFQEVQCHP